MTHAKKSNRLAAVALAALTLAGPMAGAAYADPPARHDRSDRNDNRNNGRWDDRQYNGYNSNGRWHYGQPSAAERARSDYRPGYQAWRRGDRLPNTYRARYVVVDYHRAHLRAPPRGYHYVRDDRGSVLLVGIATGVILSVLASQ